MQKKIPSQKSKIVQKIIEMDYHAAIWFYNLSENLTPLLKAISLLGTIQFWAIISLVFFVFGVFFNQSFENMSIVMGLGILISLATVSVIKALVKRKRPYQDKNLHEYANQLFVNREPYISKAQQSFPSGHMFFWLMELVFFYSYFGPWIVLPFLVIFPLMFTSRLHLGVHFLSDAIMGTLMGIVFGILTQIIYELWVLPLYTTWIAGLL